MNLDESRDYAICGSAKSLKLFFTDKVISYKLVSNFSDFYGPQNGLLITYIKIGYARKKVIIVKNVKNLFVSLVFNVFGHNFFQNKSKQILKSPFCCTKNSKNMIPNSHKMTF
jgi:hypothetical protein